MQPDVQTQLDDMKKEIELLKSNSTVTRDLPWEQQDAIREIVNDKISQSIWNNFFYTSAFTPFTVIINAGTPTKVERLRDPSVPYFLSTDMPTKFRCNFDFGDTGFGDTVTAYVTTAHVRTVSGTDPILSNGAEFLGLKIVNNNVYLVSYKDSTKTENVIDIKKRLTLDETISLEIQFFPRERADFYINNIYVGTMTGSLPNNPTPLIYYPILCHMTATDGGNHKLNMNYYEFIQVRKNKLPSR